MKTFISWTKVSTNVIFHDHEEVLLFQIYDFQMTKCMGILNMKLIIIVMIKNVRHVQKYDCDVINCSLDWTVS